MCLELLFTQLNIASYCIAACIYPVYALRESTANSEDISEDLSRCLLQQSIQAKPLLSDLWGISPICLLFFNKAVCSHSVQHHRARTCPVHKVCTTHRANTATTTYTYSIVLEVQYIICPFYTYVHLRYTFTLQKIVLCVVLKILKYVYTSANRLGVSYSWLSWPC